MGSTPYNTTPTGYYVIAAIAILNGLYGLVSGIAFLGIGASAGSGVGLLVGLLLILFGLPALIGGYGLAKNTAWGWWLVAIIIVFNVLFSLGTVATTGELTGVPIVRVVLNIGALVYMILARSDSD